MKLQKSVKKIDQHKEAEEGEKEQHEAPVKQLQEIPQEAFRKPTYVYADQVKHQQLFYKMDEEASDEIVGYLTEPIEAPGSDNYRIESKNYPKVTLQQLETYRQKIRPIIILRNETEVNAFLQLTGLGKQPLHDMALKAFSQDKNVWFLPNKQAVAVDKDCESLEELKQRTQKATAQPQATQENHTELQLPKMKKILLWMGSIFIGVVCVIFAIQGKYFNHVFTNDNKLVDMTSLYEVMQLQPGVSKAVIKKQYRKLAVKYHPDRNPDCADCAEIFDKIAAAYKQLVPGDPYIPTGFDDDAQQVVRLRK